MSYFIGIDGGGTRCRARLRGPHGSLLGEGLGGPANIRLGLDQAWGSILAAIDAALGQAGLDRTALSAASIGLGLAGITHAADAASMIAAAPVRFRAIAAESDGYTACLGAFAGGDGGILIAGTGSAAYLLVGGRGQGLGGWGFEVSDEGSGAWIGREAIRSALHAHDGIGPRTALTSQILERLGGSPSDIVAWVGGARPGDYGSFCPTVLRAAEAGDVVGLDIRRRAAAELARYVRRMAALGAPAICFLGGLSGPLSPHLPADAAGLLTTPRGDALEGGILLARRALAPFEGTLA